MTLPQKLNLKEWIIAVGIDPWDLAQRSGVTQQTIREAENPYGIPISARKAEAICRELSKEHGKPITIEDVRDLKTI